MGDLYLPVNPRAQVICLLHGGFWRMPYGRDHIAPIIPSLVSRGFAVWNLEYRRVPSAGAGWPGTLQDVGRGIDHLAALSAGGEPIDLDHVTVVGHSAGGHLALWSALAAGRTGRDFQPVRVKVSAAAGLAPVADLAAASVLHCGNAAVESFLGGPPGFFAERYRTSSPAAMLPLGVRHVVIHGTRDADVPVEMSRGYAAAARSAGDEFQFVELPATGHMDFVDPDSEAHAALCSWLTT